MPRKKGVDLATEVKALQSRVAEEVSKNREIELLMLNQSRLATMGEMFSHVVHQWRQPLNELSCMIQMLKLEQSGEKLNEAKLDEFISDGMLLVRYLSQTVDDFRDFFQPSRNSSAFELSVAVENAVSLLQASLKSSGIDLFCLKDSDCKVFGRSNEISQVLLNIINNARDALLLRKVESPQISVSHRCENDFAVIIIKDNAGGIPLDIIDKIFEPYFTTKQKSQGTGLGLYMSKLIVEHNGMGTLKAANHDSGAEFRLSLPVYKEPAA